MNTGRDLIMAAAVAPNLPPSTTEAIDNDGKRWVQVGQAVTAGTPLETAQRKILGWGKEELTEQEADRQAGFLVGNEQ